MNALAVKGSRNESTRTVIRFCEQIEIIVVVVVAVVVFVVNAIDIKQAAAGPS